MRRGLRTLAGIGIAAVGVGLAGCASTQEGADGSSQTGASSSTAAGHGHDAMDHKSDGGPAPAGIAKAVNPKFAVGTKVTLRADHMAGMDRAAGTVVGAFATHTYAVDYQPTNGGARVSDHKWVVQEEIEGAGSKRLADGDKVTLTADHASGMKGAQATIAESTDQTVYMVDYQADGMTMKNHKWVTEDELEADRG